MMEHMVALQKQGVQYTGITMKIIKTLKPVNVLLRSIILAVVEKTNER